MTRKRNLNHSVGFIAAAIAILILSTAFAVAQTTGAGPQATKQPLQHQLLPGNASRMSAGGLRTKVRNASQTNENLTVPLFLPVVNYGSGGDGSWLVTVADVNGDGKPDIVLANEDVDPYCGGWQGAVGVLLGNGDGTFQPPEIYCSGGRFAFSVAVADVNGDSIPDLVVTNSYAAYSNPNGAVEVMLGNGNGTFRYAGGYYYSGGLEASSVAVADVNGDGKPDLLVANSGSGTVAALLGNGDGTFQPAVTYDSGGSGPWSVAVADVNGDHKLDLVVTNQGSNTIGVLLGNGD